jgi:hypothetical protein
MIDAKSQQQLQLRRDPTFVLEEGVYSKDTVNRRSAAIIEKYPLQNVKEAYERMASGNAEFRVVLTM